MRDDISGGQRRNDSWTAGTLPGSLRRACNFKGPFCGARSRFAASTARGQSISSAPPISRGSPNSAGRPVTLALMISHKIRGIGRSFF